MMTTRCLRSLFFFFISVTTYDQGHAGLTSDVFLKCNNNGANGDTLLTKEELSLPQVGFLKNDLSKMEILVASLKKQRNEF